MSRRQFGRGHCIVRAIVRRHSPCMPTFHTERVPRTWIDRLLLWRRASALRFPKAFASALVVDQPLRLLAKPHSGGGKRKANIQIVTWNISRSLLFSSTPLPLPLPALGLGQSASYRLTNKLRPGLKPSRAATVSTAATNEVLTLTANSCFFTGFCISISIWSVGTRPLG